MVTLKKKQNVWLAFLLLVLAGNYMLYNTSLGLSILKGESQGVVVGSLIDFVVVMPVLFMLYKKKFSVKQAIVLAAAGCIAARFIIPIEYLEPFVAVTWGGFAVEGALVLFEVLLVVTLVRYMPKILADVRASALPDLFSFAKSVEQHAPKHPIIQIICAEFHMFYYAFASWKRKAKPGLTLHKNSSYIAFQIMIIHAIVIETIGIHWWLHEKSMVLSIILLIFNVYSVVFFVADMQAIRLNPVHVSNDKFYLSLGLMKRVEIRFADIEEVIEDKELLEAKLSKDTIDFVARDFGEAHPQFILNMKEPIDVTFMMGIKKQYKKIAIKADQVHEFRDMLVRGMVNNK
ncbi:beta-carotene 15,15'-monooxygenase [Lysinibacillus sp. NPDC097287]|uniref:beta-carotene 15,15'-monooxygenase n=1 Tax=Lysinibacillus sp. NPDC097287 TaxID=3364144 RepID=UPI003800CE72